MAHFEQALQTIISKESDPLKRKLAEKLIIALKDKLDECRKVSPQYGKLISNLDKEHFASVSDMEEFILEVVKFIGEDSDVFVEQFFSKYDNYRFCGKEAEFLSDVNRLGFSLTRHTLKTVIESNRAYLNLFNVGSITIDEFLNRKAIGEETDDYDHMLVKGENSTLWITWSYESDNPFDFMIYNRREEVYNALALKYYYRDFPIFIFEIDFRGPLDDMILIRPTIFDAGTYEPFLPVEETFLMHGYTDPHNSGDVNIAGAVLSNSRRPEALLNGNLVSWNNVDTLKEL